MTGSQDYAHLPASLAAMFNSVPSHMTTLTSHTIILIMHLSRTRRTLKMPIHRLNYVHEHLLKFIQCMGRAEFILLYVRLNLACWLFKNTLVGLLMKFFWLWGVFGNQILEQQHCTCMEAKSVLLAKENSFVNAGLDKAQEPGSHNAP